MTYLEDMTHRHYDTLVYMTYLQDMTQTSWHRHYDISRRHDTDIMIDIMTPDVSMCHIWYTCVYVHKYNYDTDTHDYIYTNIIMIMITYTQI